MESGFATVVGNWAKKSETRMLAIWRESTKRMVSKAQSRIPIDTGFARASIRASLQKMPQIDNAMTKPIARGPFGYDSGPIVLTIANAQLGQTIYIGWTANYVPYLENGHSKQAPSGFIRLTALEWPQIVREVTAEAKARASFNG